VTATEARANIFRLMDDVNNTHQPITITGKRSNSVLVSEADWKAIQETLYLTSIPNMVSFLLDGKNTPVEECVDEIKW